jgi:hypothetical protein
VSSVALYTSGDHVGAAMAQLEALDLAEAHALYDRLEWIFRDIALFLPDEFHDLARELWSPTPERTQEWWPDPKWDRKRKRARRRV